jgi:hypothetical protein
MNKLRFAGYAMVAALVLSPLSAGAHCDSLDGPVVRAAKIALENGDVTPVLKWVRPDDEAAIKAAFQRTVDVRAMGPEAQELADLYFFETVVRTHRESEGAPYTGLKPEGSVEAGITLADAALDSGSAEELLRRLTELVRDGVKKRFEHAVATRQHADQSVARGREYVVAYVEYIHYIEAIHEAASIGHAHESHSESSEH